MVCLASGARCTVYGIQFKCTVYIVHHTMADVQCTAYSVQRTVYSVQCTVYSVQRFCWPGVIQLGWLVGWLVGDGKTGTRCVCLLLFVVVSLFCCLLLQCVGCWRGSWLVSCWSVDCCSVRTAIVSQLVCWYSVLELLVGVSIYHTIVAVVVVAGVLLGVGVLVWICWFVGSLVAAVRVSRWRLLLTHCRWS